MMRLGKLAEHLEGGRDLMPELKEIEISDLVYDSRKATVGTLFFCLRGAKTDGHRYAESAYRAGCRCFVCEYDPLLPEDAVVLTVKNSREALADLSAVFYDHPARKLHLIGVTGTKGKSTVSAFIHQILNKNGCPCGLIGTTGAEIGDLHIPTANTTPESKELHKLLRQMVDAGLRYAVMEVSSQAYLTGRVRGIRFEVGVFTNLSPDHIGEGEHDSFENYRACKAAMFRHCDHAIVNADDPYSASMTAGADCTVAYYGFAANHRDHTDDKQYLLADAPVRFMREGKMGIGFDYRYGGIRYTAALPLPGEFNVYNALAAAAVCRHYGVPHPAVSLSLEQVSVKGRFETVEVPGAADAVFVLDYAHNGVSLRSVLRELRSYRPQRLVVLFGSVGGRTELRRKELGEAAAELADFAILTADNPDFEDPKAICRDIAEAMDACKAPCEYVIIPDRADAIRFAVTGAKAGDVVLLAGKGHEDYQLIEGRKVSFSEREILAAFAEELAAKG